MRSPLNLVGEGSLGENAQVIRLLTRRPKFSFPSGVGAQFEKVLSHFFVFPLNDSQPIGLETV